MDDNKNIPMEDEEVTILTLHDDEGNEEQFELLDLVDYQDKQYIVLFPVEDDDMEIVILQVEEIEGNDEEEAYVAVEDEAILDSVYGIFLAAKRRGEPRLFYRQNETPVRAAFGRVFRFRIRIPAWALPCACAYGCGCACGRSCPW